MAKPYRKWKPAEKTKIVNQKDAEGLTFDEISREWGVTSKSIQGVYYSWKEAIRLGLTPEKVLLEEVETPFTAIERELFSYLKNSARTMRQLCRKFDKSPETIKGWLLDMEVKGYLLVRQAGKVSVSTTIKPQAPTPAKTLADETGMIIPLGFISDKHCGGAHSQPSAIKRCVEIMGNEYGVRHFFGPGDATAGVYVYPGQDLDLIPECRPASKSLSHLAVENQVWIASSYIPYNSDAEYYEMGGNHDWKGVRFHGLDPIKMLCDMRDDMHYMGYHQAGLWLTDKLYLRMWHPAGGMAYAKSYRLQKGVEGMAIESLKEAIKEQTWPATSMLIAGHIHIHVWLAELPIASGHVGCFQGKSGFEKMKGYDPRVGGTVIRLLVTDDGRVQRAENTFLPFEDIKDDWKNFPTPEIQEIDDTPDELDVIFEFKPDPDADFVIEDPREPGPINPKPDADYDAHDAAGDHATKEGLGPGGRGEYVGGKS